MQISDENIKSLSDLGLSVNQAKVYLCVLHTNGIHFQDISRITRISREDVYKIVPNLEKMGLTERLLDHPMTVRALPIEIALANLMKTERETFDKRMGLMKKRVVEFTRSYRIACSKKAEKQEREDGFVLLTQKNAIINKSAEMINLARNSIDVTYSEAQLSQFISVFAKMLKHACNEGVKMRLMAEGRELVGSGNSIERSLQGLKSFDLRYAKQTATHCIIIDQKQALHENSPNGYFAESSHLWTDNKILVELLAFNFDNTWQTAEPRTISQPCVM